MHRGSKRVLPNPQSGISKGGTCGRHAASCLCMFLPNSVNSWLRKKLGQQVLPKEQSRSKKEEPVPLWQSAAASSLLMFCSPASQGHKGNNFCPYLVEEGSDLVPSAESSGHSQIIIMSSFGLGPWLCSHLLCSPVVRCIISLHVLLSCMAIDHSLKMSSFSPG